MLFVLMKFFLNEVIIAAVRNEKVGPIDFTPTAGSRPCRYRAVDGNCQLTKTILASRQFEEKLLPARAKPLAVRITVLGQRHWQTCSEKQGKSDF